MWTRRQLLTHAGLGLLGAGTAFAMSGSERRDGREGEIPDGSASKGMITPEADRAIAGGLAFLAREQHNNGSFGTYAYSGNVAVTSLAAWRSWRAAINPIAVRMAGT